MLVAAGRGIGLHEGRGREQFLSPGGKDHLQRGQELSIITGSTWISFLCERNVSAKTKGTNHGW